MRKFIDERDFDKIITESDLRAEYDELKTSGETDDETFSDYLSNCMDKNGSLTEIEQTSDKETAIKYFNMEHPVMLAFFDNSYIYAISIADILFHDEIFYYWL